MDDRSRNTRSPSGKESEPQTRDPRAPNILDFPFTNIEQAREIIASPENYDAPALRAACVTLVKIGNDEDFRALRTMFRARTRGRIETLHNEFGDERGQLKLLAGRSGRHSRSTRIAVALIFGSALAFWVLLATAILGLLP